MSGKVTDAGVYRLFKWEVRDFFKLPKEPRYFAESEEFRFEGDRYCLRCYPNSYSSGVLVVVALVRLSSSDLERDVEYEIGCRKSDGGEVAFDKATFSLLGSVGGIEFYKSRSFLKRERDVYVPGDVLTLHCRIISGCQREGREWVSCAVQTDVTNGALEKDENCSSLDAKGVEKLQSDYKRLLTKGAESDACLVVRGKEFQAHRNVLRARSPVFEAMFDHETEEKKSGRVVIDDLTPDRFQDFLEYLYTGRVETFSDDNVFGLYTAADKYDVPTLKTECVEHLRRSVSVDNFCDVVNLALRHGLKDLLQLAVEFFKENVACIILTVKWQQFMRDNTTTANELFIKLHVPGKESDNVLVL